MPASFRNHNFDPLSLIACSNKATLNETNLKSKTFTSHSCLGSFHLTRTCKQISLSPTGACLITKSVAIFELGRPADELVSLSLGRRTDGHCVCTHPNNRVDGHRHTLCLSMPIIQLTILALNFVDTPYSCPLAGTPCPPKHCWHYLWTHSMATACPSTSSSPWQSLALP